jgi:ribonuclease HI
MNFNVTDILGVEVQSPWDVTNFTFLNPFKSFGKSSTADIVFIQLFNHHRQMYCMYTPVFTDGSKCGRHVGLSYIIGDKVHSHKLHPAFSIFSAEILAIFKALENIKQYGKGNYLIYTDSLSTLLSLTHPNSRSHPLVFKIIDLLKSMNSTSFSIRFCWVPSHVGIAGNEAADKAAKSASNQLSFPLPLCDAKNYAKQLVHEIWQKSWNLSCANKLHSVKPEVQVWPSHTSRKCDVVLTRLRIGHTRYTHCYLLLGEPAPLCQSCKVLMTVRHILVECPNFNNHRSLHFKSNNFNLIDLLGKIPHQNIFKFLHHINFFQHI